MFGKPTLVRIERPGDRLEADVHRRVPVTDDLAGILDRLLKRGQGPRRLLARIETRTLLRGTLGTSSHSATI
jgi:hypothetical protein